MAVEVQFAQDCLMTDVHNQIMQQQQRQYSANQINKSTYQMQYSQNSYKVTSIKQQYQHGQVLDSSQAMVSTLQQQNQVHQTTNQEQQNQHSIDQNDYSNLTKLQRRHERIKEKNRRAQRKFRSKQRVKKQQIAKQCQKLQEELNSLQAQKDMLNEQNTMLQQLVQLRHKHDELPNSSRNQAASSSHDGTPTPIAGIQLTKLYKACILRIVQITKECGSCTDESKRNLFKVYQVLWEYQFQATLIQGARLDKHLNLHQNQKVTGKAIALIEQVQFSQVQLIKAYYALDNIMGRLLRVYELRQNLLQQINLQHLKQILQDSIDINQTVSTQQLLSRLHSVLKTERHIRLELEWIIYVEILGINFSACIFVNSYPTMPDIFSIANKILQLASSCATVPQPQLMQTVAMCDQIQNNYFGFQKGSFQRIEEISGYGVAQSNYEYKP